MANEKRLIDANALLAEYDRVHIGEPGKARKLIEDAPTVDAVEVVHGEWYRKQIGKFTGVDEVCCSICGSFIGVVCSDTGFEEAVKGMNYCHNCGAKMDGGNEDV